MYQKIVLVGRLGKDAETFKEGTVAVLNVATTENWKDKNTGEWQESTEWTKCVAFGKFAESLANRAKKGDLVLVEGKKQTNEYVKDGVKRYEVSVKIDNFKRLSWTETTAAKPAAKSPVDDSDEFFNGMMQ